MSVTPGICPAGDRDRFLEEINELCADTYCEGAFEYDFRDLECHFEAAACTIAFRMITDAPTRAGLSPRRLTAGGRDRGRVSASLVTIVPPSECDRYEARFEPEGPPCTLIEAICVLSPLTSVQDYQDAHWDMLSNCVALIEDAVLDDSP